ncbi:hypothetical protein AC77_5857 [Escherichia coli 5-366-08_S4_C1]|nr:hypothetical protein AC77_5857 [Escherichia coli 5-366-08_S4_C1]
MQYGKLSQPLKSHTDYAAAKLETICGDSWQRKTKTKAFCQH